MEDALRGAVSEVEREDGTVLILVLMEDALRDELQFHRSLLQIGVLILVLMEDALRGSEIEPEDTYKTGLNPCSNGRCSARKPSRHS